MHDDPDEEFDVSRLPSKVVAESLRGAFAEAAQTEYDAWSQDADGYDEELGAGGICHLIADRISSICHAHGIDTAQTVSASHEVHVYVVAAFTEGVFEIDVPHRLYERGGGYNWTKLPGITFDNDDIAISCFDARPQNLYLYCDE